MTAVSNQDADVVWALTVAGLVIGGAVGLWGGFAATQFMLPQPVPDILFFGSGVVGGAVTSAIGGVAGMLIGKAVEWTRSLF